MKPHLFRGLFELIMATLLRVVVRKRRILEDLATLRALDALSEVTTVSTQLYSAQFQH